MVDPLADTLFSVGKLPTFFKCAIMDAISVVTCFAGE
jgi:hypothetical protein